MNFNFDSEIIKGVHWLNKEFEGRIVFCGSFGLKLNNYIDRIVNDLDVFTEVMIYGTKEAVYTYGRESSGRFQVNGEEVYRVAGSTPNGVPVDYLWKNVPLEYDVVNFHGVDIKVEKPIHAINAKEQYIKSNETGNRDKHIQDLEDIKSRMNYDDYPDPTKYDTSNDLPF